MVLNFLTDRVGVWMFTYFLNKCLYGFLPGLIDLGERHGVPPALDLPRSK